MLPLLVSAALAQDGPPLVWTPLLQIRPRYSLGGIAEDSGETLLRSRLGVGAERGEIAARVVLQDLRGWTVDGPMVLRDGGVQLAEGWARLNTTFSDNIGVVATVGRQPIQIDDGRIVGREDFPLGGRFLDAVRVQVYGNPFQIEAINARRLDTDDPLSPGVNILRVGAAHDGPVTKYTADALLVVDARGTPVTTGGGFVRVDTGRLRTRVEGYAQGGDQLPALFGGATVGWVFGPDERVVLSAITEVSTGDDGQFTAFDNVLGDTWPWFGRLGVVDPGAETGAVDHAMLFEARATPELRFLVTAHHFWSPATSVDLGWEADGEGRWWVSPFASIGLGISGYTGDLGDTYGGFTELDVRF